MASLDTALSNIQQSLNALHQKGAKTPRYGQALIWEACGALAARAGAHYLANSFRQKAAVLPAMTGTPAWAGELVNSPAGQLVLMAQPRSAFATIMARANQISILGQTQQTVVVLAPPAAARFVAEGDPAPVTQGSLSSLPIGPKKISGIVGFSAEQSKRSNIDSVARQLLTESLGRGLDVAAFSDQLPFGLLMGVTATTAEATPLEDVKALLAAMTLPSPEVCFIVHTARLPTFLASVGDQFPFAVLPSSEVGDMLIAVDPAGLAGAISGGEIDVTTEATLHFSDQPSQFSTPGTPPDPNVVAAPIRDLWQTDSYAMKIAADMAWKPRPGSVAYITAVSW